MLTDAYGTEIDPAEVMAVMARRLDELADFSEQRAAETGRRDLLAHAAMYRRDAHAAAKGLFK
ncbi:hypothetical protein [Salininema proteolyticum]|uniref:Uncharacterized protein n=2 Tax=Salininema proteolyticum TaxID=1607685 RepID=A0ABV8U671_9ACTN